MGKKAGDKPKGRMSAYAYFVQTCREEHKKKHPNKNVVFAEFSRKCSERWKTMLDKEKKRFQDLAEGDKKRYENEMATYVPPRGEKGKPVKRRRTKDPNAPKRALSAFFWFCQDERSKVKLIIPDSTVGEVAKELGKRWGDVSAETKSRYEAMAAKDKARYEKEINAYKNKAKVPQILVAAVVDDDDEDEEDDEEDEEEEEDD